MNPPEIEDPVLQNIVKLVNKSGYELIQRNGQRHYGPPPNWSGPPPRGCEVFVGKLPRNCYEDEIVPVFEEIGIIYELRLMMDFSGFNRGFGFVRYTNERDANNAVAKLNNYMIRSRNFIVVSKSIDNDRLFVGGLPLDANKEEVFKEFSKLVPGIVDVAMYSNLKNPLQNRGFVFLQFESHHSAALARRALIPGPLTSFGDKLVVDWAEPEPVVGEDIMKQVRVLFVRHITARTSESDILYNFSRFVDPETIERIKKIQDYAFVHFTTRRDAEKALREMNSCIMDGSMLEIKWARPVDKVYVKNIHRQIKKNSYSTENIQNYNYMNTCAATSSTDTLEDYCRRMNWGPPKYEFRYVWMSGLFYWSGSLLLQAVRLPNCCQETRLDLGPFECPHLCFTQMDVMARCSELALAYLSALDFSQQSPI